MGGAPSASKTWSYRWKRRRRRRGNWVETIPRFGGKSGLTPVSQLSFLFSVGTKKKPQKSSLFRVRWSIVPTPSAEQHQSITNQSSPRPFLFLPPISSAWRHCWLLCASEFHFLSTRTKPSILFSLYIHVLYTTYRGRRSNHRDKERSTTPGLSLLSHADDEKCHRLFTSPHFFFYGTFCLYTKPCAEREKGDKGQI